MFALIRHAEVQSTLRELESEEGAWSDLRDLAFEDEDFLFLFGPEFDGIEATVWAREQAVVGLKFKRVVPTIRLGKSRRASSVLPRLRVPRTERWFQA